METRSSGRLMWAAALALTATMLAGWGEHRPKFPEGFAPAVQQSIDKAEQAKDCTTLQDAFNNADANQAVARARGASAADLMDYIGAAMKAAGC
jgi:hypothetical protein